MLKQILALVGLAALTLSANAALYDRGNGMIYDDTLNVTWLQDANYAQTSGYDADGRMTWADANTWANQLVYGGYDNWRLASAGSPPIGGYNDTSGEMGYMYYSNLGNQSYEDAFCSFSCLQNTGFGDAATGNTVYFLNIQHSSYWYGEEWTVSPASAWIFGQGAGLSEIVDKTYNLSAWAVADGDIAPVPIPAAAWLFGSALIGLAGIKRKK